MWKNLPTHRNSNLMPSDLFKNFFGTTFIDDLFDRSLTFAPNANLRADIRETEQEYIIEAEIPGFKKEDIAVEWAQGCLTITAKNEQTVDESKDTYVRRERHYGEISRRFAVDNIKPEEIKGEYSNGILTIILPKADAIKNSSLKIDIK